MKYLDPYLQTIISRGNPQLADSVKFTATEISNKYLKNFTFCDHKIGLLFGNVQSGKTGQMFGVICAAADLGFPVFILLTTDNVVLQKQTIDRVKADLRGFCICDEYDSELFAQNCLMKPTIIVLKKNGNVLKQWANIMASTGFMRGNPLFIIDDEADAASLNTLINRGQRSSINSYLDEIKNKSACSIYLQVTGTPQAILLQTMDSGWHPYFIHYFKPGSSYLGGDFFFPRNVIPSCVTFNDGLSEPLHEVVLHHLIATALIFLSGGKVCNCLLHPSVRQAEHNRLQREIINELKRCRNDLSKPSFHDELEAMYISMHPMNISSYSFIDVLSAVNDLLVSDGVKVLVMNSASTITSDDYSTGSNIVIGGNSLGRGVTFPSLQTIYYTRTTKKPQADTMWQHSRMFGYDRDPGMMMVYIDRNLYKIFSDINATNNSIISQVERGLDNLKIHYPEGLNPTRKNVIDKNKVRIIMGGTNYFPYSPDNKTIDQIDTLLASFDENEVFYQVSLRLFIEVFDHITSGDDFEVDNFKSILKSIVAVEPSAQGVLVVRRDRDITKGTGALLSASDWKLSNSFSDKTVLTMYKVTGIKGWGGRKLWVPNIKLPNDIIYYNVDS